MVEIWVDEEGNEYTADELDFETPKAKETRDGASTKDYTRATVGLIEDFLPFGEQLVGVPAAYIASKITGEPYEEVRSKMTARGEEAKKSVSEDLPMVSSIYNVAVPLLGSLATLKSGMSAAGAAAPSVLSAASKIPGATKAATAVGKGAQWLADKPIIRTALSTDPLKSSAAMSGLVGAGTAAVDLAKGESLGEATVDALSKATDTFAYMYGGRALPYKAVPLAMAGYEAVTNPIERALNQQKPITKEGFIGDIITGTAGGALARTARPAEGSTVKGSKLAKQADLYKDVTDQSTGDIDIKALQEYSGQKNLRDIPLEANVATQASLKSSLPKQIRETGKHHGQKADIIGKQLKADIVTYEKGATTEAIRRMEKQGSEAIATADSMLRNEPPITAADVKRVFAGNKEEQRAFLNYYAEAYQKDNRGMRPSIRLGKKTELKPAYVLAARRIASNESHGEKYMPSTIAVRDKAYDLFKKREAVDIGLEGNRLYSRALSLKEASKKALEEGRLASTPSTLLEISGEPGANRELTSQIKRNIEAKVPTGHLSTSAFDVKTLPANIQNLLKEYDYHRTMESIANQELVRKGTRSALSELEQRAIAAHALRSNFAAYTGIKETAGWLGKHLPKKADKAVLDFMSNVPAEKAIEALKAKPGSVLSDSMIAEMLKDSISKLPKKGGK